MAIEHISQCIKEKEKQLKEIQRKLEELHIDSFILKEQIGGLKSMEKYLQKEE